MTPSHERPVWPGLGESAGEPVTCDNALKASRAVRASRPALAPVPGSRGSVGRERGYPMSTKINDNSMSLEIDGQVIATAEFREHAAADGHGAWIVSCHSGALVHPEPGDHGHGARGTARRGLRR